MKIYGDYHTHSKYSKFGHGRNTISQMVVAAENVGLREIAITDHAPGHLFGILKKNIIQTRKEIDEINKTSKVKVLLGLECNLLSFEGDNDFPEELADLIDVKIIGFHQAGFGKLTDYLKFTLKNIFSNRKKYIEKNTQAYINAITKHQFHIISHPQEYIKLDILKLAKVCESTGTLLEINNRHYRYTAEEINLLVNQTNVKFIINSDAHSAGRIADVKFALEMVEKHKIPKERIVNLEKTPIFKK